MSPLNQKHCITYASVQVQLPHLKISTLTTAHHSHHLRSHHLSLPLHFTPDLNSSLSQILSSIVTVPPCLTLLLVSSHHHHNVNRLAKASRCCDRIPKRSVLCQLQCLSRCDTVSQQIWWIQVVAGRPQAHLHSCDDRPSSPVAQD